MIDKERTSFATLVKSFKKVEKEVYTESGNDLNHRFDYLINSL